MEDQTDIEHRQGLNLLDLHRRWRHLCPPALHWKQYYTLVPAENYVLTAHKLQGDIYARSPVKRATWVHRRRHSNFLHNAKENPMPDTAMVDDNLTFASFAHVIDSRILRALADLEFSRPTLVQSKAIPLALEGKDILARARTGSGKTAAYCIPVIQKILSAKSVSFKPVLAHEKIFPRHIGTRIVGKCAKNARLGVSTYARVSGAGH